jgi:hypothetical protein
MGTLEIKANEALQCLVGLSWSIARRAASMANFHFGKITYGEERSYGQFGLHLQCPWRLEHSGSVFVGASDLWEAADQDDEIDWSSWDYEENENLRDSRLQALLGGTCPATGSSQNETGLLVVESAIVDSLGDVRLSLSGGYSLVIFPDGLVGEQWRLLPSPEGEHFVYSRSEDLG